MVWAVGCSTRDHSGPDRLALEGELRNITNVPLFIQQVFWPFLKISSNLKKSIHNSEAAPLNFIIR